jgi:acid stress chaperone HdeA
MSTMKRSAALLASGLIAGAALVWCSPAVTGGDTSCKDYSGADDKTQNDAVSKMLKDEKGTDATQIEITATKLAVGTWCSSLGKPDSKIKEAPHG